MLDLIHLAALSGIAPVLVVDLFNFSATDYARGNPLNAQLAAILKKDQSSKHARGLAGEPYRTPQSSSMPASNSVSA
jgi:hypothetical protein